MSLAFNANFTPLKDLNDFNAPKALIYHQVLPLKPSPCRLPEPSKRGRANNKKKGPSKASALKGPLSKNNGGDLLSHS